MPDESANSTTARRGKIGRLPRAVRQQLNERLREGEQGPTILPWLNSLPEVQEVVRRDFEGVEISPGNLSEWRNGGLKDWLREQERIEHIAKLSEMSFRLARASGGNMAEGAIAIAGGQILEVLEDVAALPITADKEDGGAPNLKDLVDSIVALRHAELGAHKVRIDQAKLTQKDKQLAFEQQKWKRQTLEMFVKYYADTKAREIMESGSGKAVKMEELSLLMFGENPFAVS